MLECVLMQWVLIMNVGGMGLLDDGGCTAVVGYSRGVGGTAGLTASRLGWHGGGSAMVVVRWCGIGCLILKGILKQLGLIICTCGGPRAQPCGNGDAGPGCGCLLPARRWLEAVPQTAVLL